jgi:phage terminase large subunit-like protein
MSIDLMHRFIDDVKSGRQLSCKPVIQAIDRHISDIERLPKEGFYFDEAEADRCLRLVSLFKHTGGELKGTRFNLQPYQAFIIGSLFGWKRKNGYRRFREGYFEIARKNGKTELAAAIANLLFFFDGEQSPEVYSAATTFKQAELTFKKSKIMLRMMGKEEPLIKDSLDILKFNMSIPQEDALYEPVHSNAESLDGLNPHGVIIDEYHEHPTSDMRDIMLTGMGSRMQPMLVTTTTAGYNLEGPCYQLRELGMQILSGNKVDESMFIMIFTQDSEDEWMKPETWIKSNPNIGNTPYWDYMMSQFTKAKNQGGIAETQFKTKNLNIWVRAKAAWLRDERWMKCAREFTMKDVMHLPCYIAIDLAASKDLSVVMYTFVDKDNKLFYLLPMMYMPEVTAISRSSTDKVDYMKWAEQGYINLIDGDTIDQNFIKNDIIRYKGMIDIQAIDYDPWNSTQTVINMIDEGFPLRPMPQTVRELSGPMDDFYQYVMNRRIVHDGNPVLRWMIGNTVRKVVAGGQRPDKNTQRAKNDAAVAAIMTIGGYRKGPINQYLTPQMF